MGRMTVISSFRRFLKYRPSLQASDPEMYSASVDEVDTVGCLDVVKLIRAPSMITQLPENDFLSVMSCAQSESAMMVIFALSLGVFSITLSTKGVSVVVFR